MVAPLPSTPLQSHPRQDPASPSRELRELLDSIAHRFDTDPVQDPILPSLLGCLVLHLDEEFHRTDTRSQGALPQEAHRRREQTRLLARATDLAAGSRRAASQADTWESLATEFADLKRDLNAIFLAPP